MAIIRNANREWSYLFLMTSFARDPLWLLWNEGNFDTDLLYNSCLNSLQAKKWCSSLSSLHIDEELEHPWCRPKIDLGHFLLARCSCPNYLDRVAVAHTRTTNYQKKPYPLILISPALMRLFFCSLLQFSNYLTSSSSINAAWHFFHILRSQSSLLLHWKTVQISCHKIPAAL